jgi:lipopolysaccharide transport system permease protein
VGLDLRSLWEYRELLYFLTWREVKLRYRQTVLGAAWAVVQPLFMSLIFALFFGRLAGISSNGVPYLIFAYSGLLLWTFFANSVNNSGGSVVGNANLITKVYFPRLIIPGAAVGAMLVDFAVAFAVLALLMVFFGVVPTWGFLLLPVLIALTVLLALGFGTWMAALNVKYRDIRYALPFVIQISLFTSPVIYPANLLPEQLRLVYALNPLTGIIENWRAALFGLPFDWPTLAVSVAITLVLLAYSLHAFRQTEKSFADVI